jgi:hypothetical protein
VPAQEREGETEGEREEDCERWPTGVNSSFSLPAKAKLDPQSQQENLLQATPPTPPSPLPLPSPPSPWPMSSRGGKTLRSRYEEKWESCKDQGNPGRLWPHFASAASAMMHRLPYEVMTRLVNNFDARRLEQTRNEERETERSLPYRPKIRTKSLLCRVHWSQKTNFRVDNWQHATPLRHLDSGVSLLALSMQRVAFCKVLNLLYSSEP